MVNVYKVRHSRCRFYLTGRCYYTSSREERNIEGFTLLNVYGIPSAACAADVPLCYCIAVSFHCNHIRLHNRELHLQYIVVQTNQTRLTENQVKVFERFCHPETFALIQFLRLLSFLNCDVCDSRIGKFGECCIIDRLKHAPCSILKGWVTSDAIEDEDGLDSFRSMCVMS
jgi:hypothetical protein